METKHINDEQIAMVADALNAGDLSSLPSYVKTHIAECNECANNALIVSELARENDSKVIRPKNHNTKNPFLKYSIYIIAAASIIILFLVFYLQKPIKVDNNIANSSDSLNTIEQIDTSNTLENQEYIVEEKQKYIVEEKINNISNSELIAFVENSKFEKHLSRFENSATRSNQLAIISKQIVNIADINNLKLEWSKPSSPILIEIYNNKGDKILSEETMDSVMSIECIKTEGLYYWRIIDEDFNLIYCGKIIYKK